MFLLFPDRYQKRGVLYWPLYNVCAFLLILALQMFLSADSTMLLPVGNVHTIECALCIGAVAIIPSALLFGFLRNGKSVYPFLSGLYAVLMATGIGCLMLRLAETSHSIIHITLWHYLPTLLFAGIGAFMGRIFLKW